MTSPRTQNIQPITSGSALDPNSVETYGYHWTALHRAVYEADVRKIAELLARGANIVEDDQKNYPYEVSTYGPLRGDRDYMARRVQCEGLIRAQCGELIRQRNEPTHYHWTGLHRAVYEAKPEEVKKLLRWGAPIVQDVLRCYPHQVSPYGPLRGDRDYMAKRVQCIELIRAEMARRNLATTTSTQPPVVSSPRIVTPTPAPLASAATIGTSTSAQLAPGATRGTAAQEHREGLTNSTTQFSFGSGDGGESSVTVTSNSNSTNANKEFFVRYRTDSNREFTCRVREVNSEADVSLLSAESSSSTQSDPLTITIPSPLVQQESQHYSEMPEDRRHSAAIASLALKNISELRAAFNKTNYALTHIETPTHPNASTATSRDRAINNSLALLKFKAPRTGKVLSVLAKIAKRYSEVPPNAGILGLACPAVGAITEFIVNGVGISAYVGAALGGVPYTAGGSLLPILSSSDIFSSISNAATRAGDFVQHRVICHGAFDELLNQHASAIEPGRILGTNVETGTFNTRSPLALTWNPALPVTPVRFNSAMSINPPLPRATAGNQQPLARPSPAAPARTSSTARVLVRQQPLTNANLARRQSQQPTPTRSQNNARVVSVNQVRRLATPPKRTLLRTRPTSAATVQQPQITATLQQREEQRRREFINQMYRNVDDRIRADQARMDREAQERRERENREREQRSRREREQRERDQRQRDERLRQDAQRTRSFIDTVSRSSGLGGGGIFHQPNRPSYSCPSGFTSSRTYPFSSPICIRPLGPPSGMRHG